MFKKRPPAGPPDKPAEAKPELLSTRALVILALSAGTGLIMGLGAGPAAGILAGLTTAVMLHQLVDRTHG